jgi:hypothetical protein
MGEDEMKKLEECLRRIQEEQNNIGHRLAGVEVLLKERCNGRGHEVRELKRQVDRLRLNQAYVVGGATIATLVINLVVKFWK